MHYQTALIQLPLLCDTPTSIVRSPGEVAELCADLTNLAQEAFHVVLLNTRNRLINRHLVSLGVMDSTLVHPREVFRPAILQQAAGIVLVHNHPSGDPSPSAEDLRLTRELVQVGQVMRIAILDHVIIGRKTDTTKGYLSLRESGIFNFDARALEPSNGKKPEEDKTAKEVGYECGDI